MLAGAATEIARLRAIALAVQDATGWLAARAPDTVLPPDVTAALQSLDLLAQHLDGLAGVLDRLAVALPAEPFVDAGGALECLSLSELRATLSGAVATRSSPDIELF